MLKRKLGQHEGGRVAIWEMDTPLPCSHLVGTSETCSKETYYAIVVERSSKKEGSVQVVFPYCISHIKQIEWCKNLIPEVKEETRRRE